MSEKYIKKYKTITSSSSVSFDEEINFHLKNGWEILDNSHNVNVTSNGDINVHVKVYKDNSDDYQTYTNSETGYTSTSFSQVLFYKDKLCYDLVFYENGMMKERNFNSEYKENGVETHWYESGQKKSEVKIKDGQKNGMFTEWLDESGEKYREITYKNGLYHGLYTTWRYDSSIDEENFKNGLRHGISTVKNSEGQIITQKNYNNDILEGEYFEYYDDGQLKVQINYSNGEPEGEVFIFNENGSIHQIVKIKDGKVVNNKRHNGDGVVIYEESYKKGILEKIKNNDLYGYEVVINKDKSTNFYISHKKSFNKGKLERESKSLVLREMNLTRKFKLENPWGYPHPQLLNIKIDDDDDYYYYKFFDRKYYDDGKNIYIEIISNIDSMIREEIYYYDIPNPGKKEFVTTYKIIQPNFTEPEPSNPKYYRQLDFEEIERCHYDKRGVLKQKK